MSGRVLVDLVVNSIISLIAVYFFIRKKHDKVMFFLILSLMGDLFNFSVIGPKVRLAQGIGLLAFTKTIPYFFLGIRGSRFPRILNPMFIEYGLLIVGGIWFGFLFPWRDPLGLRTWGQSAPGRTIITLIRELCHLGIVLYVAYIFLKKYVSFKMVIRQVILISMFNFFFAVFSTIGPVNFRSSVFVIRDLSGRFCGFNGEPKAFGKASLFALILCLVYILHGKDKRNEKVAKAGMVFSAPGIILSGSTSTFAITIALLFVVILFHQRNPLRVLTGKYYLLTLVALCISSISIFLFSKTEYYQIQYAEKVGRITQGEEDLTWEGEPLLFRRWEMWDRAAANFFYHNPKYLFFGVGPNLIHIPMTKYATAWQINFYGGALNTIPRMGWLQILSRTGFFGLCCWILIGITVLTKFYRQRDTLHFLLAATTFTFAGLTMNLWLHFMLGYLVACLNKANKTSRTPAQRTSFPSQRIPVRYPSPAKGMPID